MCIVCSFAEKEMCPYNAFNTADNGITNSILNDILSSYQLTECMLLLHVLKSTGDKAPFSELDF